MPPSRPFGKNHRNLAAVLCVAALFALLSRYVLPSFASTSIRPSISVHAHGVHRQFFDHEGDAWVAAPGAMPAGPLPVASPRLYGRIESIIENVRNGWHYNRPPPVG